MEHRINVETGPEYPGENYIWCECKAQPGTKSLANSYMMDHRDRESMFHGGEDRIFGVSGPGPEEAVANLLGWLREHGAFPRPYAPSGAKIISERCGVLGGEPPASTPSA